MINYFLISIYILSIFAIFIIPIYINIKRDRVVALSFLPPLLIATTVSIAWILSYFFNEQSLIKTLMFSFFLFFEFLLGGYIMMLPILILVAFIIEYLRVYYHYKPIRLALIAGVLAAMIVGITFATWKFIWVALVSGFISVWLQYYLTEYKKS